MTDYINRALKVWKHLEPEMTKEAKVISENINKIYPCDYELEWTVNDCIYAPHLFNLIPIILSNLMPEDKESTVLDIGCSIGFLAPFCEYLHINYIGVDQEEYKEHVRFKQDNAHYVRYIKGDVKDINSEWAKAHNIEPSKTLVICAYCPPCQEDTELSRAIKARLAHDFEQCLIL